MNEVVIAGAARTPMGGFQGEFDGVNASILGGVALKAALDDAQVASVDELYFGNVLPAGQGQAPARQAGFAAGLGEDVPATTLNKMCGSGMKATMIGYDQLALGHSNVVAVGGMESMSNAPYLLPKMRGGARIGHGQVMDHMFLDGLEDAYDKGRLMGTFAEDCAEKYQFTREAQDEYALGSLSNALDAQKSGAFAREIAAVTLKTRKGEVVILEDEQPKNARPEKIPHLKPAFREGGTVTPGWFATAPIPAAEKLLKKIDWEKDVVDLWEVNEAFAVVPMAFMRDMQISRDKMNVNGGACALGHPIGASGARILVTLLNAMETRDVRRGVATICIGGGEGTAIAIERT
ncbi:MAG: acetyl-CoA C-acetyltransferase [Rhodobacteraceae bacterium]|nr:acetyl-CoA C-acetyltransferase [Paracoccaceae bacterium]